MAKDYNGIWNVMGSCIDSICDTTQVNLRGKPILTFAVLSLILISIIVVPVILIIGWDIIIFYLISLIMIFVIIMTHISNKNTSEKGSINIVDPKKNENIWADFKGSYYAFNAPFELEEKNYSNSMNEKTLKIHRDRYSDKNFKSNYLYFKGENHDERETFKRWISNFMNFFENVETAKLGDNLKLYVVEGRIPDYTFFAGEKNNKSCSIFYPFRQKSDTPDDVFLVHDEKFYKSLEGIFDDKKEIDSEIENKDKLMTFIN